MLNASVDVTTAPAGAALRLDRIWKRYDGGARALDEVSLDIPPGEFLSIVGPSGCGKSTLLRILAGLVPASGGTSTREGQPESAFVFQDAALLPWRTVEKNAQLLMELEGVPAAERRARAAEMLRRVGLAGFEKAYAHQLSGGMRMRLSLARALALRPALLLLDEPLAAVDELTRDILQEELSQLWRATGFTALMVTHNVHEAVYLSHRVLVMSARPGRILEMVDVPFPFPRTPELRATGAFAELTSRISGLLRSHGHI